MLDESKLEEMLVAVRLGIDYPEIVGHALYMITMSHEENHIIYRYSASGGTDYTLMRMKQGTTTEDYGQSAHTPRWLNDVLALATVGGYFYDVDKDKQPYKVVWFETDYDNNLLKFLDVSK